jgi:arabinofuranosyltransferase
MKDKTKIESLFILFPLALYLLIVIRRAWVGDDAYITFRTVDNFIHGYGLVWNVGERVQAYTHPLWMFLLTGVYALTRELHFTSLIVSTVISLTAVAFLATRLTRSLLAGGFAVLTLTLSRAFVDYSTSGLENPLSHLLMVLFAFVYLSPAMRQRPFWLSFLTSLLLLTRLDLALLVLPALLLLLYQQHDQQALQQLIMGGGPLLAWEGFSLFYYGFPVPNTYYAKLNTGIPTSELIQQGFQYFLNLLEFDPLTLLMILAVVLLTLGSHHRQRIALGLGIILYLVYILRIGGDFMTGRFLSVPLLLAICLLTQLDFDGLPLPETLLLFAIPLLVGLGAPNATLDFRDTASLQNHADYLDHRGIVDERQNLATFTAPLALPRDAQPPTHIWAWQGTRDAGSGRKLALKFGLGFYGFNAGPGIYVIDQVALADPLLARLPAARDIHWRVGHYFREIPAGYERTIETGKNTIKDDDLALYYDKLTLITRGSLFSKTRLLEILKMNLGFYDHLIDWDKYRYPALIHLKAEDLPTLPPSPALSWDAPETRIFQESGLEITWKSPQNPTLLEISLSSDDDFLLIYLQNGQEIASQTLLAPEYPENGLATHRVLIPDPAQATRFDTLRILPIRGEDFSLGNLAFLTP